MICLRESLRKIDIYPNPSFSYQNSFFSKPNSIRQAIRSMDAPQNWREVDDINLDEFWTDEVQGVAWDGSHLIFSCNANQRKPACRNKALYTFSDRGSLNDNKWISVRDYKDVPHPISGTESDDHWGQLTYHNGYIYVSHFWEKGSLKGESSVVVFKNDNGNMIFDRWINIESITTNNGSIVYPEFQTINPWDGNFYSWVNGINSNEFFIHDNNGLLDRNKKYILQGYLPLKVQGACFSPNGHLYIAEDTRYSDWDKNYKWILYYSALNGKFLGKIPVLAKENDQELECICYSERIFENEIRKEIWAVLLENRGAALDNVFIKSFQSDAPDII